MEFGTRQISFLSKKYRPSPRSMGLYRAFSVGKACHSQNLCRIGRQRTSIQNGVERVVTDDKHRLPISLLKLFDLVLVAMCFGMTTILVVHAQNKISLAAFLSMRTKIGNVFIFLLALSAYHFVFHACGLYVSRRLSSRSSEIVDVVKASGFSLVCFVLIGLVFSVKMLTLPFLALFWVMSTVVLCTSRFTLRLALARIRVRGRNLRYMLILGTNPRAVAFARRITASPERGYRLLGFVDDEWPGMADFRRSGFQVVSSYARLAEFLRRNVVDEVAVYLPFGSLYSHWSAVISLCAHHGIIIRLNSDIFGLKNARWRAEDFDGNHYIATYTGAGEGWPLIMKRALDIVISSALLLLLAPSLIAVAIGIKLTSPGPVLFLQERVGLNKRRFKIYKFRTMVPNAEQLMASLEKQNEASGPVFKIKNDPRITPIGKFLRRSSIDELPQLLNVLKGDMSLVGPRPLPVRDYEGFNEDWQRRRFSVKPGITCLWQVNGRSEISFDQWMLLDLQYMDEWSLWLDLKILARTVPAVVRGYGAA
jgi:exopolysaccharide biosynthesis polyprenyl glycosylphosphotransferase